MGARLRGRARAGRWRALACAVVAPAVITLGGCGSVTASAGGASPSVKATASPAPSASHGAAAQAALCQDAGAVTGLEIVRSGGPRVPEELHITFPGQVTVSDPAKAQAVARAVCALPRMPGGVLHCPMLLLGTVYLLRFTVSGTELRPVTIEATGCEAVTGAGPVRWVATSPGFWRVLATVAGLSPPGRSVFSGTIPAGSTCQPPSRPNQANGCPAVT